MLTCIHPPLQEPVSLKNAKDFLKIDDDSEDSLVEDLIKVARQFVEDFTGQSLLEQQWQLKIFPQHEGRTPLLTLLRPAPTVVRLRLPKVPVITIKKVQLQYDNKTSYTLKEKEYRLETDSFNAQLSMDALSIAKACQIKINYIAGYGTEAAHVPPLFIHAVLMKCAELYENRGDQSHSAQTVSPTEQLLKPYKVLHFGLNRLERF